MTDKTFIRSVKLSCKFNIHFSLIIHQNMHMKSKLPCPVANTCTYRKYGVAKVITSGLGFSIFLFNVLKVING